MNMCGLYASGSLCIVREMEFQRFGRAEDGADSMPHHGSPAAGLLGTERRLWALEENNTAYML